MDDTIGTGTVFQCRADKNIIGWLRSQFLVENYHFGPEHAIFDQKMHF